MLKSVIPNIEKLKFYQPGMPISQLQRMTGLTDIIKLASNENPLGPSALVLNAVQNIIEKISLYPDSSSYDLKQALAKFLSVSAEQLVLTNGAEEALPLIARAFVKADEEIIVSQYGFIAFSTTAQVLAAKLTVVPAIHWGSNLDGIAQAVTENTKLIFIANPNNPTGTWFDYETLKEFLKKIPSHVVIVLDEAYYEYTPHYTQSEYNAINLLPAYENLIIIRTFSKAYGLAGLRIGYAITHSSRIANIINHMRTAFNINLLALAAAEAALEDQEHLHKTIQMNKDGMQQLQNAFNELELSYIPAFTNFLTVDMGNKSHEIYEFLLTQGVIVRPLNNYTMNNYLRITVGLVWQNQRLIENLKLFKKNI